jgi:hypothetical protein
MDKDKMTITILDDGTIKIETDRISQANHMTAEAFMRFVAQAAGGRQDRKAKHGVHHHHHHDHVGHSH